MLGKRLCKLTLLALLYTLATPSVYATALYDALASATLTIESIDNLDDPDNLSELSISAEAMVLDDVALQNGNASAQSGESAQVDALDPTALEVDDSLSLHATASGDATGNGTADSAYLTNGLIELSNDSLSDTFEISFFFDYELLAAASVMDAGSEVASSSARIILSSLILDSLFDEEFVADTDLALEGDNDAFSLDFVLTLAPGESDLIDLTADAEGIAEAFGVVSVPTSSSLSLLAFGLLGIFGLRLKR